jgi:signal transduction histidine kinase
VTASGARSALDPAALHDADGALAALVSAWPDPALVAARDGRVLAANESARRLLGVADDAPAAELASVLGPAVAAALLAAGPDPVERVVGEDAPAGRQPVLRVRAAALGESCVVVALADASGESRLRSHLGLAEKLASIGELLSSVAHELNNPLTAVLGYADLLLSEDDPHLPRDEIERIRSEAVRCKRIVGNLLDLARADSVDLRPLVLTEVVDKVMEFRAYACRSGGIELVRDTPETPVVLGDFHRLVQAVLNLVTNAEDAVKHRPQPRRVSVRTRAEGARVFVEVEDNGEGVPAAIRPYVFQPFFTTKPRGKGTGLGLSLVRDTARTLGGDVRCEDAPGGGARFVMELPTADTSA